jgi:outer membrane protein OmpA-like peptidoglycan-associated protein
MRTERMLALAVALGALSACRGGTSTEPPIVPFRGMHEMPRYDAQEYGRYFADDHRSMRPIVAGTLPREADPDLSVSEGLDDHGDYVATIPDAVVTRMGGMADVLERGHGRFDIYCAPCHGLAGDGRGPISRRAERIGATFAAANLTDATFLHIPDGRLFLTITNGIRTMPAYRAQIPTDDRWAIVAYVRALQLHAADPAGAVIDADGDAVQAWADHCLDQAEDPDGFADADGCPEDDNDGDGLADGIDGCPNAPGPARAAAADGTPPAIASGCPELVRVEATGIALLQPLRFATGSTRLTGRSEAILGEVRAVLAANPDLTISVEGHTDDRGDPEVNRRLSERRAHAVVDWLVDHDIEVWRLGARGWGSERPVGDNATAAGRAANRRIELRSVSGSGS